LAKHLGLTLVLLGLIFAGRVQAQDLESNSDASGSNDQEVEALYDKEEDKPVKQDKPARTERVEKPKQAETLSDLATLSQFSDVAVIQRRFLPKTKRFELSSTAFTNLNNPFFTSFGLLFRGAYYFTERYAAEALFSFATTDSRQVTDDLETNRGITTDNVVTSNGFMGAAFKWNPIYGKMTWLNQSIVPFDLNFSAGLGLTSTTEEEKEFTYHFGASQVFAVSKGMAVRWDLILNHYSATSTKDDGTKESLDQNDLFLGLGMSFYFPEATYR
jgi:outer membrane beta-barrel protein